MSVKTSALGSLQKAMAKYAEDSLLKPRSMTAEQLQQLSADIESQVPISGPAQAAEIIPEGPARSEIGGVLQGTPEQRSSGRKGALKGALASAGVGALGSGLAGGVEQAPKGLFLAIPGAIGGYQKGVADKRQQQLMEALQRAQQQQVPIP